MRLTRTLICTALAAAALGAGAHPAAAAVSCPEPGEDWQRATPEAAGMDAAKLQDAMDYGSTQLSFAVRVYRRGCLVGEDRLAPVNRTQKYESYSMAKSITSVLFGRAMQQGLIGPDDPVGALVTEADRPHGAVTMRNLLTMTSGLRWNGFRDYNVFTMPDRVRDALTLEVVRPRGTYYEYAQSPVALLAEATGRAAGKDAGAYAQEELMGPLGIEANNWHWGRDPAGHIQGFYGVNMRPDDFGRFGELLRRGGVWRGRRLLATAFMEEALQPAKTNGCYGWLIWLNRDKPCVGPRVSERPVVDEREFPDLPADIYHFSGLFGQLVTVFPSQEMVLVRTGQDPNIVFAGGASYEHTLYRKVLGSITDQSVQVGQEGPGDGPRDKPNSDAGFQNSLQEPDQYSQGANQQPLPPAGPARARAAVLSLARPRASRRGVVSLRVSCPPRWLSKIAAVCRGMARVRGARPGPRRGRRYRIGAGRSKVLRFKLTARRARVLRRAGRMTLIVSAKNRDAAKGTYTRGDVKLLRAARRR